MDIINKSVSVNQLLLDPNNFRLDYEITEEHIDEELFLDKQACTLEKLEEENIEELRQSILENGFIEIDRIVVKNSTKLKGPDNLPYYIVIEGNRRTAALKTLYDDYLKRRISVPEELKKQFEAVNVCLINSNDEEKVLTLSASLMGIRHVSGPKKWKGVQAAKLIDQLHRYGKNFKEIGHLLGIDSSDAKRRYEGFLAFLQMKNDKRFGNKCTYNHYALLLEFISNRHSKEWLDWNEERFQNDRHTAYLYEHLTKQDNEKRPEIKNPGDARTFNRYLAKPEYARKLSEGAKMSELPELPKDDSGKVSYISKFNTFLNNMSDDDSELSENVEQALSETSRALEGLLKNQEREGY